MQKIIRISLGAVLVFIGVIGLFLPLLQGVILIIIGILLIQNKPLTKYTDRIKQWFRRK